MSFHSIEDKIVKYFFSNFSSSRSKPSRYLPEYDSKNISLFNKYKNEILNHLIKRFLAIHHLVQQNLDMLLEVKINSIYPNELIDKFNKYLDLRSLMFRIKLIISIFIFSILLGVGSTIKNKTRIIEKEINKLDKKIEILKKDLHETSIRLFLCFFS